MQSEDELKETIRGFSRRIALAKERNAGFEELDRLRVARMNAIARLVRDYDVWPLINDRSEVEFLDYKTWDGRIAARRAARSQKPSSSEAV